MEWLVFSLSEHRVKSLSAQRSDEVRISEPTNQASAVNE